MAQILYTEQLLTYIRDLLWNNVIKTDLGLTVVQEGDISFYESPEQLSDIIPCILIRPSGGVDVKLRTMNFKYDIVYRFRVVYIFKYTEWSLVVRQKIRDVTRIADVFFANTKLSGITTLTNSQVIHSIPTTIEYDPPEDGHLALLGGQLISGAINLEILTSNSV
jgi:hypothetical protein